MDIKRNNDIFVLCDKGSHMLSSLRFFFFFAHFHKRYVLLISNPSNRMEFEALITKSSRKGTLRDNEQIVSLA